MRALQADIFETVEDLTNDPVGSRKIAQGVLQILQGTPSAAAISSTVQGRLRTISSTR